jgi:adenylate kinase
MTPLLPKVDGICDECGGELIQRADDNVKTIKKRMMTYKDKTVPMEEYFMESGTRVMTFEPKRGVKDYNKFKEQVLNHLDSLNLIL